ncbi:hypothetical protein [Prevotella sp. HUN102]|uniref:hypothetical protein n=1 Tax=Prevotella sp. HUN102 TaxID=1392486 RepID=UPI0012DDFBBF|nr:hypothetical protein [Prevotella sp. HUN102]
MTEEWRTFFGHLQILSLAVCNESSFVETILRFIKEINEEHKEIRNMQAELIQRIFFVYLLLVADQYNDIRF